MKLKRAPYVNRFTNGRKNTSEGAYEVVGTCFVVFKDRDNSKYWFIQQNSTGDIALCQAWLKRHGLSCHAPLTFTTRAQVLDALEMALEEDPL